MSEKHTSEQTGTDLYRRIVAWRMDSEHAELTAKVWKPTPWMIDVRDGSFPNSDAPVICEWCNANLGPESLPIHGKEGVWHRGGATVSGHTWYGFATQEMMSRFIERWPKLVTETDDE